MKIRLGLIGLGEAWHTRHAPALHALADRFEIRAVCEPVAHRAKQVADEFAAASVGGFQALLRREDIDAVLMLSDQWYGPLPVLAACEQRKAVYCAMCFDMPSDEAEIICRQVDRSGIAFMAEFLLRYTPGTLRLKELIATQLGEPRLLFCNRRLELHSGYGGRNGSTLDRRSTRRELIELVDWCRYLVAKEPSSVTGLVHAAPQIQRCAIDGNAADSGGEDKSNTDEHGLPDSHYAAAGASDYQAICLDFSAADRPGNGPLAQIACNRYFPAQWQEAFHYRTPAALQIVCRRGIAFLDLPATLIWFDEAGRHQENLEHERPVGEQLLTHFFRAVTSLVRNKTDLEDAYRSLRIVQQSERSAAEGRRIELDP